MTSWPKPPGSYATLVGLRPEQWSLATPAVGWSLGDQVSHLAYFDVTTLQSLVDPEQFRLDAAALKAGGDDLADRIAAQYRGLSGEALLAWFQTARAALVDGYRGVDPGRRLPWYGPDMTPASSVTARLMETWAHGQDIFDALGTNLLATGRLRHVADLGIRAMPYSYAINDLPFPTDTIMVSSPPRMGRPRPGVRGRRQPCRGQRVGFLSCGHAAQPP